jgi:hypothetical protein
MLDSVEPFPLHYGIQKVQYSIGFQDRMLDYMNVHDIT